MEASRKVRFGLFGKFRIEVDGLPIELQDRAFFSYLRLLILSGELYLANSQDCPLGIDAKAIRDIVDKGNTAPRPGQGGRYDFTAKTGLSLRYREGYGLELQGGEYESDVAEFEEACQRLDELSDKELEDVKELYGNGVNLKTWPRERVLNDCQKWIESRVQITKRHREEIETELERRRQAAASEPIRPGQGHGREWNEETKFPIEISGLSEREKESGQALAPSTNLRQELGGAPNIHEKQVPPVSPGSSDPVGIDAVEASNTGRPVDRSMPSIQKSAGDSGALSPTNQGGRTYPWFGLAVIAGVLIGVFFLGYTYRGLTTPDHVTSEQDRPIVPGTGLEKDASNHQTSDNPTTSGDSGTQIGDPENSKPVALRILFRPALSSNNIEPFNDEVLVAKRIFPGYIGHRYKDTLGVTSVAVLNLGRQFQSFHCAVGLRDDEASLVREKKVVRFVGDNHLLKQMELQPGILKQVDFPVTGIGTLTITFVSPTVIVNGSCSR